MRLVVLGGTGFIGSHVVRQLSDMGHDVTAVHRGLTRVTLPASVRTAIAERTSLNDITGIIRTMTPDVVVHMIAMTGADANTLMTAVQGVAGRVVVMSSIDVYRAYGRLRRSEPGPPDAVPLNQEAPLRSQLYPYRGESPRSADDADRWIDDYDKILVERVVMGSQATPGTILRLPMVYGPGDPQHRLFTYIKRMDDNRPAILLQASEVAPYREADWVKRLAGVNGWAGRTVAAPDGVIPAQLHVPFALGQHWWTDTSKIRAELGYTERVPLKESLQRTIAWERANQPKTLDPALFNYAAEDEALSKLGCS